MSEVLLSLIWLIALFANGCQGFVPTSSSGRPFAVRSSATTTTSLQAGAESFVNVNNKKQEINLLPCDDVILPGERVEILTEDIELIEHSLVHHSGVVAVGLIVDDEGEAFSEDDYGDFDRVMMLETASMCEIKGMVPSEEEEDCWVVTLQGVGRVRVMDFVREHPFVTAQSIIETDDDSATNATANNMLADNIEALITKLTKMDQRIRDWTGEDAPENALEANFEMCYASALHNDVTPYKFRLPESGRSLPELAAISWATFCAVETCSESYRMKAMDWDNLTERLKLAQYMLREEDLHRQGQLMKLESESSRTLAVGAGISGVFIEEGAFQ